MKQAVPTVCFADSDEEDYVSFDENELNDGINDLYDDDSASDAGSDIDKAEYYDDGNNNNNDNDNNDNSVEEIDEEQITRKQQKISKRINKLKAMKKNKQQSNQRDIVHKQKINANVIHVELGTLKDVAENVATGDPINCQNNQCRSILSKYDKLLTQDTEIKLDDEDERIWVCNFCSKKNIIQIHPEQLPDNETVDYILAPPDDIKSNTDEKLIIFCVDISGSMCVTQPVEGKKISLKGDRLKKEQESLSQFIDPDDRNQWMPNQKKNVTYVSRLQSVQAAAYQQISNIYKTNCNYKIGLVTFNNDVCIIGDGMNKCEIIAGDKLNNLQKLKEIGINIGQGLITNKISESFKHLSDALWKLEDKGQTALGPALCVSIAMCSAQNGSQVILCTDGLANKGVGVLDDAKNDNMEFYECLGQYAIQNGVVVNVISIVEDGCKLEALGKITEITNGKLRRINPLKLTEKFSGILTKELIATSASVKMIIHPGLQFIDTAKYLQEINPFKKDKNGKNDKKMQKQENIINIQNKNGKNNSICMVQSMSNDIGNVFDNTDLFFEYQVCKERREEFKNLKYLPFQVQIHYNKIDGTKMFRVISQQKEVSFDKKEIRKNLDFNILSKFGTEITTKLCDEGDYEASRAWTNANVRYMHNNVDNDQQLFHVANHINKNVALDYQMKQQQNNEIEENDNDNDNNSWAWRGQSKGRRKGKRNDKFSSYMYARKVMK